MKREKVTLSSRAIVFALMTCSGVARADMLRVPSEFPKIQYALDASIPGDVVLVAPGTYEEQITIEKPRISIESEVKGAAHVRGDYATVWVTGDSVTINGLWIEQRFVANGLPGLVLIGQDFVVESCTVTGGAVGVGAISSGRVRQCVITETRQGMQVAGRESQVIVEDTDVLENASMNLGGGLAIVDGAFVTLVNCRFVGNSADITGGAIYAEYSPYGEPAHLMIDGCLFQGNSAVYGAAIETTNCQAWIFSCTFVGNVATGGGPIIAFEDQPAQPIEIRQCIIAFNTGYAMSCIQAATPAVSCSDVFGNTNDSICGVDAGGNISADPAFCALPQNDFHLHSGSPCAPANSPGGCDLIGAFPVSCLDSVAPVTWGALKHGFLQRGAGRLRPLSSLRVR